MKTIIIVMCLFFSIGLPASIINIPADQPTIQGGLNIAIEGDSVIVAEGIYYENIIWPDVNGIRLIGISEDNCIIDGNSNGSVIYYERWDTIHDSTTVIKNFTIQNGLSGGGAGIYLRSENQFLLENLTVKDNFVNFPLESEISTNRRYSVEGGGGIHLDNYSSPIMRNIKIIGNYSEFNGGGLFIYHLSEPILENVLIANNYTEINGGGISCECGSNLILNNVTVSNNIASENGGGIFIYGGSSTSVLATNCIFWNNSSEEIYFDEQLPGNSSISISYSDVQGGEEGIITNGNGIVNWLEGNIVSNPLFVNPSNANYHLTESSPCIDAGDPNFPFDPDGTITDMGTYYFDQLSSIISDEIQSIGYHLSNYPNPFNPTTTISFSIYNDSNIDLSIFNIKGQKIKTLANNDFTKGNHSVIWNGDDESGKKASSGIYLYKLNINGKTETVKKCLLLK
ncbi:MAG: T9SS type A sorting domain-containing protein [Candidatus Cloacimonadota bacterium]|nr:T9SS type A sorting domain-containing protein [Candidatus Cloacimonadota bacterium]